MRFKEIEFKYQASIGLTEFIKFCEERKPKNYLVASGYDHFFQSKQDKEAFCRHRIGPDSNQLTFKRKLADNNNFIRTEHNIDLSKKMRTDAINSYLEEFGYVYNTSLFKNCFIYQYADHILVYYVVYDTDMSELGRFIEIEMAEDGVFDSEGAAWEELTALEKICRPLGISAQSRVKRSLFEMFKAEK